MSAEKLTNEHLLPSGVTVKSLIKHEDERGQLTEFYRQSSLPSHVSSSIQWNYVKSQAGVLRGVHTHRKRVDNLILLEGRLLLGLRDIRRGSPTEGMSSLLECIPTLYNSIYIPSGVMHGFYFIENSIHVYGIDSYWDPQDNNECQWNDPDLEIPWPVNQVILSQSDRNAPSYKKLISSIDPFYFVAKGNK